MVGLKGDLESLERWAASHQLNGQATSSSDKKKNKTILSQVTVENFTELCMKILCKSKLTQKKKFNVKRFSTKFQLAQQLINDTKGLIKIVQNEPLSPQVILQTV